MTTIEVRGERDGLILTLPDAPPLAAARAALADRLAGAGPFFDGARLTLDIGARVLAPTDLDALVALLESSGVTLVALRGSDPESRAAARERGIALPFVPTRTAAPAPAPVAAPEGSGALLLRRTVRSGQVVHHSGAVVVIGDVNPGAEIRAGGDVVVWGALRGRVHAGMVEGSGAVVCALSLTPGQLRIGDVLAVGGEPEHPRRWRRRIRGPELARVREGAIELVAWQRATDNAREQQGRGLR